MIGRECRGAPGPGRAWPLPDPSGARSLPAAFATAVSGEVPPERAQSPARVAARTRAPGSSGSDAPPATSSMEARRGRRTCPWVEPRLAAASWHRSRASAQAGAVRRVSRAGRGSVAPAHRRCAGPRSHSSGPESQGRAERRSNPLCRPGFLECTQTPAGPTRLPARGRRRAPAQGCSRRPWRTEARPDPKRPPWDSSVRWSLGQPRGRSAEQPTSRFQSGR